MAETCKLLLPSVRLCIVGSRHLARDDIRRLLTMLVDIIVQCKRVDGKFRVTEAYYEPLKAPKSTGGQ